LIGYSINDTIVVFDRMRELKGKMPNITRQVVNDSINQTLSRTFLTFFTTFMVVVVLYAAGGSGIHGFAYAMLIGTVVGCYSSIYIAAPFLLYMVENAAPTKRAV
jgi:SecD/SecF fusion protein